MNTDVQNLVLKSLMTEKPKFDFIRKGTPFYFNLYITGDGASSSRGENVPDTAPPHEIHDQNESTCWSAKIQAHKSVKNNNN